MTKILLIQDVIPHYRIPIFNLIAQKVDLTVMIVDGDSSTSFSSVLSILCRLGSVCCFTLLVSRHPLLLPQP